MTDQILSEVSGDMDPIKKLIKRIPGLGGFIKRSEYRDADKLLRDTIAEETEKHYHRISTLQQDLISQGEITLLDDLEQSALKLRTFADRIRRAARGYAGVFDSVKINEEELHKVYQYDSTMMDLLDETGRAIDNIEASLGTDGVPAATRHLRSTCQSLIDAFNERDEVMRNLKE